MSKPVLKWKVVGTDKDGKYYPVTICGAAMMGYDGAYPQEEWCVAPCGGFFVFSNRKDARVFRSSVNANMVHGSVDHLRIVRVRCMVRLKLPYFPVNGASTLRGNVEEAWRGWGDAERHYRPVVEEWGYSPWPAGTEAYVQISFKAEDEYAD